MWVFLVLKTISIYVSLPPQRTAHPTRLALFGFFSHGIGPEGLRHTGCPFASSDRARAFVFNLLVFLCRRRQVVDVLLRLVVHELALVLFRALLAEGHHLDRDGFRCSRLIPTLRLGYGSGGRQV